MRLGIHDISRLQDTPKAYAQLAGLTSCECEVIVWAREHGIIGSEKPTHAKRTSNR